MSKILIIEDDEMILNALITYLSDKGYTTLATADGPRGILVFQAERPDVVILDLGLPSLDGRDVLKQILNIDQNAKVIITTGYGSQTIADEAIKIGAFAFVTKPFDIDYLIVRINAAISLSKH